MSIFQIRCIRLLLIAAVSFISYLAFTSEEYTLVESTNDKLDHLAAFFVLALLADFSFPEQGYHWPKILPLLLFGLFIEIIQYFLPYRTFSWFDFLTDCIGLLCYGLSQPWLRQIPFVQLRWEKG